MSGVPIRTVHTGDFTQDQAQRTARDTAKAVNSNPFTGGLLLDAEPGQPARSGLSFTAGTARTIAHGLGRKAVGFYEVYGADMVSANHVGLRTVAMPSGYSSLTHIAVSPGSSGTCFVFVF